MLKQIFNKMNVLITGCDGFLGNNLARELIAKKHAVKAFIYEPTYNGSLDNLPIELFYGDIRDEESVIKACENCDAIIHAAACTTVWPARANYINDINIKGTLNIIKAIRRYSIARLIHVSSANSFGYGNKKSPGNESSPYKSKQYQLDYLDSKHNAQNIIMEEIDKGLPAIIVNPCFMIGPYDYKPSSGKLLVCLYKGQIPAYSPGGKNFVYVKDVAKAISSALTNGKIGEAYILGHENLTFKEFLSKAAQIMQVKPPWFSSSKWLVHLLGRANSILASITRKPPSFSYRMARVACDEHYFDPDKAVRHLEMPQTPIDDAIYESFMWLKSNGILDKPRKV